MPGFILFLALVGMIAAMCWCWNNIESRVWAAASIFGIGLLALMFFVTHLTDCHALALCFELHGLRVWKW
jgi:hypothetical protein